MSLPSIPHIHPARPGLHGHRITVIGGDRRMLHAATRLADKGALVTLLGHKPGLGGDTALRRAQTLSEATRDATAVVLPLPATRDGSTVNCPFSPELRVSLADMAATVEQNPALRLFGGRLTAGFLGNVSNSAEVAPRVTDYFADEALTLRNAYLTAEGALMLAGRETDFALGGNRAAILGYGRIGQYLAGLLRSLGVSVTVAARRREVLHMAENAGCQTLLTGDGLLPLCCGYPLLFNTVPAPVLERDLLLQMEPETLIIDLASAPFGVTDEDVRVAAERNGLRYIRAPGLPGTYAPRDAGYAIADTVATGLLLPNFPPPSNGYISPPHAPPTPPKGDSPS